MDLARTRHRTQPPNAALRRFARPEAGRSLLQAAISLGGVLACWAAMYVLIDLSVWLALAMVPVVAFLLVRVFIIQHDCGHRSFFRARWANDLLGHVCSVMTLTPYAGWRRQHAQHHGNWNNLDRRTSGADIYSTCLTVEEYRALGPRQRFWHRLTRHPLVANLLLPPFVFIVLYRIPFDMPAHWRSERRNVHLTNLALAILFAVLVVTLGPGHVLFVQLPVMALAAIIGVWLFSIQHRFEGTVWARAADWSFEDAALRGSSYLRLPAVLHWLTGNIGLHHIHHLDPRIPNYALQACQREIGATLPTRGIGLREAFASLCLALWDEPGQRMATFAEAAPRPGASG